MCQVSFPSMEGVDKQALVEDWLNPDGPQAHHLSIQSQSYQISSKRRIW